MSLDQHKREHRRNERQLAAVIASFFAGQARRVSKELRDFSTPAAIDQVFRVDDEHAAFMLQIREPLSSIVAGSSYREYRRLQPRKSKAWGAELASGLWDKLPRPFLQLMRTFLDELEEQDFWREIQRGTKERLTSIVNKGLADGDATPKITKTLRQWLGGKNSKARALAIARTETTGAMNAGHYVTHTQLAAEGAITGRVWRAIIDDDTRETHTANDGVSVKAGEMFDVGGTKAPYPGWYGLPAGERVRCRCVVTAVE